MQFYISILQDYAKKFIGTLILSPKSILLFIFLIFLSSEIYSEEKKVNNKDLDYRFKLKILGSMNVPLSDAGKLWEPFPSGGIKVTLPVGVKNLDLSGVAEYGLIKNSENEDLEIKTGLIRLLVSYRFNLKESKFSISPFFGIMDMMIHHNGEDILESVMDTEIFKNVENEFGISMGVEPEFSFKRFTVSLPLSYDLLFSSPEVYQSFNTSLAIGMTF